MTVKYKNDYGAFITEVELPTVDSYFKAFYEGSLLIKEEVFYENELKGLKYYNNNNENHQTIVSNNGGLGYKWMNIIEYEYFSDFKLKKTIEFSVNGEQGGTAFALYDPLGELIAYGYKDENGTDKFGGFRKFYYDRTINPECELFECTYDDTGMLLELYWNNYHIDDVGQESLVLLNTPEDIQELKSLTGMSQALAEYYMQPAIIPNF